MLGAGRRLEKDEWLGRGQEKKVYTSRSGGERSFHLVKSLRIRFYFFLTRMWAFVML